MWSLLVGSGLARDLRTTLYGYVVAYPWLPWALPFAVWMTISAIRLTLDTLRSVVPLAPTVPMLLGMAAGNALLSVPLFRWPIATGSGSLLAYATIHAALYVHRLNLCNAAVLGTPMEVALGALNLSLIGWTFCIVLWCNPIWLRPEWPELQLRLYQLYAVALPCLTVPQLIVVVIAVAAGNIRDSVSV